MKIINDESKMPKNYFDEQDKTTPPLTPFYFFHAKAQRRQEKQTCEPKNEIIKGLFCLTPFASSSLCVKRPAIKIFEEFGISAEEMREGCMKRFGCEKDYLLIPSFMNKSG